MIETNRIVWIGRSNFMDGSSNHWCHNICWPWTTVPWDVKLCQKMWIATMDRDIQCHFKSFEKIYLWKNARNSQKWRVWKGTTVLNKTKKQTADNLYSMLSGKRFGTTDSIMIETNRTERMGTSNLVRFTKRWSPEALCYFNDQKWLGMSNCVIYVN